MAVNLLRFIEKKTMLQLIKIPVILLTRNITYMNNYYSAICGYKIPDFLIVYQSGEEQVTLKYYSTKYIKFEALLSFKRPNLMKFAKVTYSKLYCCLQ